MIFNEERLAALPLKPEYKQRIRMLCDNPDTQKQCQVLIETPDNKLLQLFAQIEDKVKEWKDKGAPPEVENAMRQAQSSEQQTPGAPRQAPGGISSIQAGGPPQRPQGGPPQRPPQRPPQLQPQQRPIPPGIAPSQMSRTPDPMDMPSGGIGGVRR